MSNGAATTQLTPHQQCGQGAHHPADVAQDLINGNAQFGTHRIKRLGLLLQLMNPHVVADLCGNDAGPSGHHGTAGSHLVSYLLHHRVGLAGERRLVDLTTVDVGDCCIHRHLIADFQQQPVAQYQIANCNCLVHTVSNHLHRGRHQDGEIIKCLLGAKFLENTDGCIGHHHQRKREVNPLTYRNHYYGQHHDQCIEPGEEVRLDNVQAGTRRNPSDGIDLTARPPLLYFN